MDSFLGNGTDGLDIPNASTGPSALNGTGQISSSNGPSGTEYAGSAGPNGTTTPTMGTGPSGCCHTLRVSCDSCSEFDQPFKQFYGSYVANHEKFNNHVYYTKGQYGIWYQSACDNCEWQIGYVVDKEKVYSETQIRINEAENIQCPGKIMTYKGPKVYYEGSSPSSRIQLLKKNGFKIDCSTA